MIETFEIEDANGVKEFVRIVNGDTATIMLKSTYDEQQAQQVEHLTEIPTQEAQSLLGGN
jgi:hypothetical protein